MKQEERTRQINNDRREYSTIYHKMKENHPLQLQPYQQEKV